MLRFNGSSANVWTKFSWFIQNLFHSKRQPQGGAGGQIRASSLLEGLKSPVLICLVFVVLLCPLRCPPYFQMIFITVWVCLCPSFSLWADISIPKQMSRISNPLPPGPPPPAVHVCVQPLRRLQDKAVSPALQLHPPSSQWKQQEVGVDASCLWASLPPSTSSLPCHYSPPLTSHLPPPPLSVMMNKVLLLPCQTSGASAPLGLCCVCVCACVFSGPHSWLDWIAFTGRRAGWMNKAPSVRTSSPSPPSSDRSCDWTVSFVFLTEILRSIFLFCKLGKMIIFESNIMQFVFLMI